MKIVLTIFFLALSAFALVDENIALQSVPESQKTDLIIKTNNGQSFSINTDGKNARPSIRKLDGEDSDPNAGGDGDGDELPEIDESYADDLDNTSAKFDRYYNNPQTNGEFCIDQKLADQIYDLINDFQAVVEDQVADDSGDDDDSGDWNSDWEDDERRRRHHHKRHLRAVKGHGRKLKKSARRHHRRHLRILRDETLEGKKNKI